MTEYYDRRLVVTARHNLRGLFFDDRSIFNPNEPPMDSRGWRAYTVGELKCDGGMTGRVAYVIWYPELGAAMIVPPDTALSGKGSVLWTDASSPSDALRRWLEEDDACDAVMR